MINKKIFYVLIALSLIEIIPTFLSIFDYNYSATKIGIIHQKISKKINLGDISWISYDILIILMIYNLYKSNYKYKYILIAFLLLITYLLVHPVIVIANTIYSKTFKNKPFIDDYYNNFPHAIHLETNYSLIKNEFVENYKKVDCVDRLFIGYNVANVTNESENKCWRTILLKKQGKLTEMAKNYPILSKLLENDMIHNGMFSILDGNVNIPPHTGYYKGYLRYHLGIIIPKENDKSPFIVCGGQKYYWKEGEGVLFDDMFLHYVENPTNSMRVVLFLDILRNDVPSCILPLYNFFNSYIENHIILKKIVSLQHTQKKNN